MCVYSTYKYTQFQINKQVDKHTFPTDISVSDYYYIFINFCVLTFCSVLFPPSLFLSFSTKFYD